MKRSNVLKTFGMLLIVFLTSAIVFAQSINPSDVTMVEVVDDKTPTITKQLPDWQNAQARAVYISNKDDLRKNLGERPIFDLISFEAGTEAVTANYDAGKLLIVEYSSPQISVEADNSFRQYISENPSPAPIYFRRVGNYEVFVFDAGSEASANELIDQVKYEKTVQWLGEDPYLYERAERAYVQLFSNVFLTTMFSIIIGLSASVCIGLAIGIYVFYLRKQKQDAMTAFSDAGGMTRLNLDGLTPDIPVDGLLKD